MIRVLLLSAAFAAPLSAEPAEEARAAMGALEEATRALEDAASGWDRISALTQVVHSFEDGLAALREGQRDVARAEARLTARLAEKEADVARLVGVLQVMERRPGAQLLLHPEGPTGSARAGMLLADVTPALQGEVSRLRQDLEEVAALRALQADASLRLREGLIGVEDARAVLAEAVANRAPLPKRFAEDAVQTAILIAASETLDSFAEGLALLAPDQTAASTDVDTLRGTLALPARGTVLRRFEETGSDGIKRPGIVLATRPAALVTAPSAGTVRYQGDLLDYGNVMILEPARDVLVVLAGLERIYVDIGDIVTPGAPLGLMAAGQDTSSTERSETLYIEVRENQEKVDPETWFAIESVRERN